VIERDRPRPAVAAALRDAREPTIVYDSAGIREEFAHLRTHLEAAFGDHNPHQLLYSVKANTYPGLLRWCAAEGIGASVASTQEFIAARDAGMSPVHATSPGFTRTEILSLIQAGVTVNVDNLAQLTAVPRGMPVGLRIQVPLKPDNTPRAEGVSRFGIDPEDSSLDAALAAGDHTVTRLHAHFRDVGTPADLEELAQLLIENAERYPGVRKINVGGGMTRLYKDRGSAAEAWQAFARVLRKLTRTVTVVVEPGAQVVTGHGYLAANVISSVRRADGRRLVTLDASKWKLVAWSDLYLLRPYPGDGPGVRTDLVGPTCYEKDVWMAGVLVPELAEGDRVIFRGVGAYVTSMAKRMHGLPGPHEIFV
jgi:diaminopimelate decarboxylase